MKKTISILFTILTLGSSAFADEPKLREFACGYVHLNSGALFIYDAACSAGDAKTPGQCVSSGVKSIHGTTGAIQRKLLGFQDSSDRICVDGFSDNKKVMQVEDIYERSYSF